MSFVAGRPWDMYRAELADTIRAARHNAPSRTCHYCGAPTIARNRVCINHTDLIDLDPGAPAALEDTRAAQSPDGAELAAELASSPSALVSSSAAKPPCATGRANGDGLSGSAALDRSETA